MPAHTRNLGGFRFTVGIDAGAIAARAEAARARALPLIGQYIRAQSSAIAPLRDGGMIGSGRVEPEEEKVRTIYEKVYAAYQHEGKDFHHPNGRQAKYLESVMEDPTTQTAVEQIFAAQMKSQL